MRNLLLALTALFAGLAPISAVAQSAPSAFTAATRYDVMGRVTGTIAPDPDDSGALHYAAIRNTYDADGRLVRVEKGELSSWLSEAVAPASWTGFTIFSKVETSYDGMDRKTLEAIWGHDTTNDTWAEQTLTQFSYDSTGRLQCTAVRMNSATWGALPASACTPAAVSATYGPDRITANYYDAAGQLLQVRKAVGTGLEQPYVTYQYNPDGLQTDVVDANGNHAKYVYDAYERLYQWWFPSTTAPSGFNGATPASAISTAGAVSATDYEQYGYDLVGNRTSFKKRDGRTFNYTYDHLNRVTIKVVPDGACGGGYTCGAPPASATRDVYTGYDAWGRQVYARFDSAAGSDGITSNYDAFGRLTWSTTAMGGISRTLHYDYDADGDRTRIAHPGTFFDYTYDGLDRLKKIQDSSGAELATTLYYPNGQRSWIGEGANGTGYCYDTIQRLCGYNTQRMDPPSGWTVKVANTALSYNPASQIVSQVRDTIAYAFAGYMTASRGYTVNGLNQYTAVGPNPYAYDSDGNLTSDAITGYGYDAENRLISATNGAALSYDPNGRLWQVAQGSATTQFLYEGDDLVAEYDGSGNLLRRYVHADGEDHPLLWYEGTSTSPYRLWADHHGSVITVSQNDGTLLAIDAYDEYGMPSTGNAALAHQRFGYTGQAWLPEIAMYYYKARIYSPMLGRFLQTDPIGYKDQINIYQYVGGDPVNHEDPTGLKCNSARTICIADSDPKVTSGPTHVNTPEDDLAMYFARGEVLVTSGTREKVGFIEKDGSFRNPSDAKTGQTEDQDNARVRSIASDAHVIHGHLPRDEGVVDNTENGRGLGDSQPLTKGMTNGTVASDGRLGVHEESNGRLQFRMIDGKMTRTEAADVQSNLNDAQRLLDKPK